MSCLNVNITLTNTPVSVTVTDLEQHLSFTASSVCGIDINWDEFVVAEGVFRDSSGNKLTTRRNKV